MSDAAYYYSTPVEVDGVVYPSVADYELFCRLNNAEEARCQKLTADLKLLIKQMVLDEKIERLAMEVAVLSS